jgi:predicted transcriptional regulator
MKMCISCIYIMVAFRVSRRDTTRECKEIHMDDYLKEALEIVKAQASVRNMTEEEITSMVKKVAEGIRGISEGTPVVEEGAAPTLDPKKAIKEKSVTCLECGKVFKILTKKHLATHNLTADEYRAKYGYKKGTPLVSKSLQRERRAKMKDMKLWEKRKKAPK